MAKKNNNFNFDDLENIAGEEQKEATPEKKAEPIKKAPKPKAEKKVEAKAEPTGELPEIDKFYSVNEAAELLHVTTRTIHNHIASGSIKTFKAGRRILIPESSIKSFLN